MVGTKEKPEFPRRLYTQGGDPYPYKSITYYSNDSKLFPALLAALSEDEWEELSESRLGVFLKFFQLDFGWASRLVHYVLGFQLECKKKYEIWSLVGVNPIRFSLNEFELLTGLNCEYVEDIEQPEIEVTEEMKEFWEQRLGVAVDAGPSIEQLTRACSFAESWSREDRIRLGYLAIFAGFIEARKVAAPTRLNLARLVMDLDAFENYPWGRVAFKNLLASVKQKDLAKSYAVEGFVEVLQVWVYYAMPEFATEYGDPIAGKPTPPMLAFKGSRGRKYVKESMLRQNRFNHFVMKDREDMFPTWDDDEEDVRIENIVRAAFREFGNVPWRWNKSHWQVEGVLPSVQISNKGNSEYSVENKGSRGSDEASRKRSRPSTSSYMDESRSFVDVIKRHFDECCKAITSEMRSGFDRCDYNLKFLTDKLEAVEHTLAIMKERKGEEDVMEKGNQHGHGETHGDAEQVKSNEHGANVEKEAEEEDQLRTKVEVPSESVNGEPQRSIEVVERKISEKEEMINSLAKQQVRKKTAMMVVRAKGERMRMLSASQKDPFVGNSTVKVIIPNKRGGGYDPFEPVDKQKVKVISDFLKLDPAYPKRRKGSPIEWFWILMTPQKWLMDTHIDAGICLLRLRFLKHPEWFRSERICFLDTMFHSMWSAKYDEFLKSTPNADGSGRLLPGGAWSYYTGEAPRYCRTDKTWVVEVDDVYAPLHITKDHWVAMWISLPCRHIVIWDSSVVHASDAKIAAAVESIAVMLPHLLRACNPEEKDKYPLEAFTHQRIRGDGVPQNIQSGDCGVFCLKYIECHALGLPFPSTLCDANILSIREKLAGEIFDETNLRGKDREEWDVLDLYETK